MVKRPKAVTWNRVGGDPTDVANLLACLGVLIQIAGGEVNVPGGALQAMNGSIGIRARYEDDGSMTVWTYDVVADVAALHGPDNGVDEN